MIQSYRPDFLKNDKTGNNFEIDIYIPEFGIALEYQGKPHFKKCENLKNNPDKSRENDFNKSEIIKRIKSLVLLEVFDTVIKGDIILNICALIEDQSECNNHLGFGEKYKRLQLFRNYLLQDKDLSNIKLVNNIKSISGKTSFQKSSRIQIECEIRLPDYVNKQNKKEKLLIEDEELVNITKHELRLLDAIKFYTNKLIFIPTDDSKYLHCLEKLRTLCYSHNNIFNKLPKHIKAND